MLHGTKIFRKFLQYHCGVDVHQQDVVQQSYVWKIFIWSRRSAVNLLLFLLAQIVGVAVETRHRKCCEVNIAGPRSWCQMWFCPWNYGHHRSTEVTVLIFFLRKFLHVVMQYGILGRNVRKKLVQPLRWRCAEYAIHHERHVREE